MLKRINRNPFRSSHNGNLHSCIISVLNSNSSSDRVSFVFPCQIIVIIVPSFLLSGPEDPYLCAHMKWFSCSITIVRFNYAPRAGCDNRVDYLYDVCAKFQSTPPCGVRRGQESGVFRPQRISIHAPRAGCDADQLFRRGVDRHFNPRTPCGVRRNHDQSRCVEHADFNPRTPCGVRPSPHETQSASMRFQSTHPVRGATGLWRRGGLWRHISIHAPRAGCDPRARSLVAGG